MKNLKDAILEKLKVEDIILTEEFPIDKTIEDMAEFLKNTGFKEVTVSGDISIVFSSAKSRCFIFMPTDKAIWFADTSKEKISKDNPIFYIGLNHRPFEYSVYSISRATVEYVVHNDKKEFLKELNKHFNW